MITLKNYIIESIFDVEDNIDNVDESIKEQIKQFLKDNFDGASSCKISDKPNADDKYEVSSTMNVIAKSKNITSLTNESFVWTTVGGEFICYGCKSLTSLKGAPEKVGGDFRCYSCKSLTSLKGAPKKIRGNFSCKWCNALTSLKGAPEKVGGNFICSDCNSLKSLEGAPKEVGGYFDCSRCGVIFTTDDVKKVSNVEGKIFI